MRRLARRLGLAALVLLWLLSAFPVAAGAAEEVVERPRVAASAAILVDWTTGTTLYASNAYQRRDPASTTKVLTALLAVEYGELTDLVTVSRRAAYTHGSSMNLRPNDQVLLGDLLAGMLLNSGNDAAVAIAEHIAGSVAAFAELMNVRARELGALNSHFVNPHGLTHPAHYSTAYDLALITRHALQNPYLRQIVATREADALNLARESSLTLHNTNRLLWLYDAADGVKTGTTAAAGRCLIASATREGHKLIAVVLDSRRRWGDAVDLLDYGFRGFELVTLVRAGEPVRLVPVRMGRKSTVPVYALQDLSVVIPRSHKGTVRVEYVGEPTLEAPLKPMEPIGTLYARVDGEVRSSVPVAPREEVRRRVSFVARLWDWIVGILF